MTHPLNVAASIRAKLRNIALAERRNFDDVFRFYIFERLLYRLSKSPYQDKLLLKGAMVFNAWGTQARRITRDLDLMGFGNNNFVEELENIFRFICSTEVIPDGLEFLPNTVRGSSINQNQKYRGGRIKMRAILSGTRTRSDLQIDIGFGNTVIPEAQRISYPTLFDFPAPKIRVYPPETVIAEKFQVLVNLELDNTRLKDYYDLVYISHNFNFKSEILARAIQATFAQRETPIPTTLPLGLTKTFVEDLDKQRLLTKFYREARVSNPVMSLAELVYKIIKFIFPIIESINSKREWAKQWQSEVEEWKNISN